MKIKIELDPDLTEDECIIRCRGITDQITSIQKNICDLLQSNKTFCFYKGSTEFYLPLDDILFFETADGCVNAHSKDDIYQTKYKLYELEDILPRFFLRISKSSILNTNYVYSINRNITAASIVSFQNCHKQVYVSRSYYKPLINKLKEKRLHQ